MSSNPSRPINAKETAAETPNQCEAPKLFYVVTSTMFSQGSGQAGMIYEPAFEDRNLAVCVRGLATEEQPVVSEDEQSRNDGPNFACLAKSASEILTIIPRSNCAVYLMEL